LLNQQEHEPRCLFIRDREACVKRLAGEGLRMFAGPIRTALALIATVSAILGVADRAPAEQPVLTLAGGDAVVALTMAELEAMPQHQVVTSNEFTDGEVIYEGPLARDVLERIDLSGVESLRFTALNDYFIDIPRSDFQRYDVIFALQADGRRLSRRDKGPLWLMYPISDFPELADPIYNARLIWQIVSVEAM
jgi:hypothetical protein